MIETEQTIEIEPEPPRIPFDLSKMNYGELPRLKRIFSGDAADGDEEWLIDLLDRVLVGGLAAVPMDQAGYVRNDLVDALNTAQSPKVRSSARSLPASDAEEL